MNVVPPTAPPPQAIDEVEQGTSLWRDAWHRLSRNKLAVTGGAILILIAAICLAGPLFTQPHDRLDLELRATPPSFEHWLGTDTLGRDLFARVLYGGRISLMVGVCATLVALIIGVIYGTVSGYAGGKTDAAMMRIVDIMYALPFTIFVILLMVFFGRQLVLIFVAIGAVEWLTMARIVRGQVMALKHQEFIEAARALGLRTRRILFRHTIPNILGPVIVYATLTVPAIMLLEAFISFLGLGVQAPATSWGVLIKEGAESMEQYWWLLAFPGLALSATLFCLNFLGDGLRDALDVRTSKD